MNHRAELYLLPEIVSPITIRLRILKEIAQRLGVPIEQVSPITIRLRILKVLRSLFIVRVHRLSFTHHDPLEDTERAVSYTHLTLPTKRIV